MFPPRPAQSSELAQGSLHTLTYAMTILTTLTLLLLYAHRLCNASDVQTTPSPGSRRPAAGWKRSNSKSPRVVPEGGFHSPLGKVATPMLTVRDFSVLYAVVVA